MPQHVFLDTEFTDLERPRLISLALVDESGTRTFYGELEAGFWKRNLSEFAQEHVVPRLHVTTGQSDGIYSTRAALATAILGWFKAVGDVVLVSDAPHYDVLLLAELLGRGWPSSVSRAPVVFSLPEEEYEIEDPMAHEAMHDAKKLRRYFVEAMTDSPLVAPQHTDG